MRSHYLLQIMNMLIYCVRRSGNKATLITRIQTDDSHNVQDKVAPTPIQSRSASSSAPVAEPVGAKVPHPHPTPAPIDEAAIRSKFIHPVLDIHLPNLSQPEPEIQVQVVRLTAISCHCKPKKNLPI